MGVLALNMNLEYARYRLEEWGRWARTNVASSLGYPSRSVENKAIFGGSRQWLEENITAEEIDRLVLMMPGDIREIIILWYVRNWSQSDIAKKLHTTRQTVSKRMEAAVGFVAGKVS